MTQKLEEARKLYQTANADQKYVLESLFPELKESEDERIRKGIIKYLSWIKDKDGSYMPNNIPFDEMIAWLEKQCKNELKDYIDAERNKKSFYYCGKEVSWNEMPLDVRKHDYPCYFNGDLDYYPFNAENNVEKQGEQKPADIRTTGYWNVQDVEQKPAWSEEDEEYINDLIGVFDGQQYQAHSDEEIVKWLKSIRLPYNKEWDENDEEMLRSIIATCEVAEQDRDSSPARHLFETQANWLKTLRPQNTWKPSDEQMKALWEAYKGGEEQAALASLYSDLKKLREE